jgi:hypothetical protein
MVSDGADLKTNLREENTTTQVNSRRQPFGEALDLAETENQS